MSFLDDLYYCGCNPMCDSGKPRDVGYDDAVMSFELSKKKLTDELPEEQAELLEKMLNSYISINDMEKANLFANTFSLAVRLVMEAVSETNRRSLD